MPAITIIPEKLGAETIYLALAGERESIGRSASEALDARPYSIFNSKLNT